MYNLGIEKLKEVKEEQIAVMIAVLNNKDTVGILPTGFGKSIVFYVMSFLKEKVGRNYFNINNIVIIDAILCVGGI